MIDLTSEKLNKINTTHSVQTIYAYDSNDRYIFFKASVQPIENGSLLLIKDVIYKAEKQTKTSFKALPIKAVDNDVIHITDMVKRLKQKNTNR